MVFKQATINTIKKGDTSPTVKEKDVPVSPFVVIPRNKLHKSIRKGNSCLGIEDAWPAIGDEVGWDNIILSVTQDPLHLSLWLLPAPPIQSGLTNIAKNIFRVKLKLWTEVASAQSTQNLKQPFHDELTW